MQRDHAVTTPGAEQAERLNDLEARLAFQDDTITVLNDALVSQQTRLAEVERTVARLIKLMEQLRDGGEEPEEGPPPHY